MSEYLVNLVRRGAGLPFTVRPRRDVPGDVTRYGADERTPEGAPDARRPEPVVAEPAGPAMARLGRPRSTPETSGERRVTASPTERQHAAERRPAQAPTPRPAPRPEHPRVAEREPRPVASSVSSPPAPALEAGTSHARARPIAGAQVAIPRPAPTAAHSETGAGPHERPVGPVVRTQTLVPSAPPPSASSPLPRTTRADVPGGSRHAAEPAPDTTEPPIEVRIGRIEIVSAPAPPPAARTPRRAPRGFQAYAATRRALDRRWY